MNIALIGFGSMGQKIKELAEKRGHSVSVIIDPKNPQATHKSIQEANFSKVEVVLDFSLPNAVLENIKALAPLKKNLVIGTTGWQEKLSEVTELVKKENIGLIWSNNFSIGVNLYYRLIEKGAELINNYEEYDIWGTELHHKNKVDSPSGTAKELAKILLSKISRKKSVVNDKLDRKILPEEIHFSSTRGGEVNFSHTVAFDSASDTLTLIHSARDRVGYALGAIKAAEWLGQKKGIFTMDDFINSKK